MSERTPEQIAALDRYGVAWRGPTEPLPAPIPDGYWTPWHIAQARLEAAEQATVALEAKVKQLKGYTGHKATCPVWRSEGPQCGAPLLVSGSNRTKLCRCQQAKGHEGIHWNGSHEWSDDGCTCGLDALLTPSRDTPETL